MRWRIILGISVLFAMIGAALLAAGATSLNSSPNDGKIHAVATISIIGDWVHVIAGNDVDLTTLVGPGSDPHDYEPAPVDCVALTHANLLFENGLGLETWLDKLYRSARSSATRVIVSRGVSVRRVSSGDDGGSPALSDDCDPHAWQSVKNAIVMVANIRDALIKADPAHAAQYSSRANAYIGQLNSLDAWARTEIASIPASHRKLVTSHDAFGYFGARYDIAVCQSALESVTTEAADPSAQAMAAVVDQIKAEKIPVIFMEATQSPRLIDQVASAAQVKVGPPLYSDSLGRPGSPGDTYIKMIQYNVRSIINALQ